MSWRFACVLLAFGMSAAAGAEPAQYPRSRLLIGAPELVKPEVARKFKVLDARGEAGFEDGHIPGAVPVPIGTWNRDFTRGPDRQTWEKRLGNMGIDPDTPVVVYGGALPETARVWWILRYWGLRDVRILDGGWDAWLAAHGKVAKGPPEKPAAAAKKVHLRPHRERLATKGELLASLKSHRFQLADARSEGEYCGETQTARRKGAIPGAKHLEWSDLLDPKTHRFKRPAELARLFKEAGISLKEPTVTYCQSGGRASVLAFALELMGAKEVRNYYRSWAEWGNANDTPIEKGKARK